MGELVNLPNAVIYCLLVSYQPAVHKYSGDTVACTVDIIRVQVEELLGRQGPLQSHIIASFSIPDSEGAPKLRTLIRPSDRYLCILCKFTNFTERQLYVIFDWEVRSSAGVFLPFSSGLVSHTSTSDSNDQENDSYL